MNLAIPLYAFLFTYFAFLFIFAIFIAINFYHIFSSGVIAIVNFIVTAFILIITIFTLFGTYQLLAGTDWQQSVTLLNVGDSSVDLFSESSL